MARGRADYAISQDRIYTMRELNQHTADVLREINERRETALITRHGRFIAAIIPLASADIEANLVGKILQEVEYKSQLLGERDLSEIAETESVADDLR
jgi:prevent-host-death family protein